MPVKKIKIIVIVGPTASGKSELAVKIAKKIGGEIISADSRQIYQNIDVGTAKVSGKWMYVSSLRAGRSNLNLVEKKALRSPRDIPRDDRHEKVFVYKGIPHYGIDFISPKKIYSAGEFKKCAEAKIKDIFSRGKTPIIVGGTGFWVDSLVYDFTLPEVEPDWSLRKKMEKKPPAELFRILEKLDPKRAGQIEKENPRRLIRAIEIAKKLGEVPYLKKKIKYNVSWIGLNPPKDILQKRISRRAREMVKKGIISETKKLLRAGVSKKKIREFGFEYKAVLEYLAGNLDKTELAEKISRDTYAYARRQMSWFKRNKEIKWVTPAPSRSSGKV